MPTLTGPQINGNVAARDQSPFGYWVMVVFSFLYYFRPGDIIPGLSVLHMARITAVLAVLALFLGTRAARPKSLPFEIKIIFAMFGWMVLTIPFSYWRGGSAGVVFFEFSKAVMVALTLTFTVTRLAELRRLILVQALGVGLMTIAAVIVNNRMKGRLAGVGDALLSNPNDLAMNIALNWPLCLIFLLMARGPLKKAFWAITMLLMIYALMATYSRAGFMALTVAGIICLWEFGVRGRRRYLLIIAAVCLVGMVVVSPGNYGKRLETLFGKFQEGDKDLGSAEARKGLLLKSLQVTATHPVFGVGPGNFPPYTGLWLVTHNTYTQLSSECGIPALVLFLILMWRAFLNLRRVWKRTRARGMEEMHLFAGALTASFVAYALGAFFSSSAYELFPYYMITYTTLLYRLSMQSQESESASMARAPVAIGRRALSPV